MSTDTSLHSAFARASDYESCERRHFRLNIKLLREIQNKIKIINWKLGSPKPTFFEPRIHYYLGEKL